MNIIKALITTAILTISATASADPVGGRWFADGYITPGNIDSFRLTLRGEETTAIRVSGSGSGGDIDCQLYDENANVVVQDIDSEDGCSMVVTPRWTGPFALFIKNNGIRGSVYTARAW